jgi:hypothetical protein
MGPWGAAMAGLVRRTPIQLPARAGLARGERSTPRVSPDLPEHGGNAAEGVPLRACQQCSNQATVLYLFGAHRTWPTREALSQARQLLRCIRREVRSASQRLSGRQHYCKHLTTRGCHAWGLIYRAGPAESRAGASGWSRGRMHKISSWLQVGHWARELLPPERNLLNEGAGRPAPLALRPAALAGWPAPLPAAVTPSCG